MPYDSLERILPTRMVGNLLFREIIQLMKKEGERGILWGKEITYEGLSTL